MAFRYFLALPLVLAACGGGSQVPLDVAYDQFDTEGFRLSERLDTFGPTLLLPRDDVRSYEGIALFTDDFVVGTDALFGDFEAEVDFGDGRLDAVSQNYVFVELDALGEPVTLQRVGGVVEYAADSLSADGFLVSANGTLFGGAGPVNVDGEMVFAFFGPDAEMLSGIGGVSFGSSNVAHTVIAD